MYRFLYQYYGEYFDKYPLQEDNIVQKILDICTKTSYVPDARNAPDLSLKFGELSHY